MAWPSFVIGANIGISYGTYERAVGSLPDFRNRRDGHRVSGGVLLGALTTSTSTWSTRGSGFGYYGSVPSNASPLVTFTFIFFLVLEGLIMAQGLQARALITLCGSDMRRPHPDPSPVGSSTG